MEESETSAGLTIIYLFIYFFLIYISPYLYFTFSYLRISMFFSHSFDIFIQQIYLPTGFRHCYRPYGDGSEENRQNIYIFLNTYSLRKLTFEWQVGRGQKVKK